MPRPDTFPTDVNNPLQVAFARIGKLPMPSSGSFGATKTLLAEENGALLILDKVDGIVFTLPAPVVGMFFDFVVKASVTSNSYKIITNTGTVLLEGQILSNDTDTAGAAVFFAANGTTHIAITMAGSTTGGLKGTKLRLTCISATQWMVEGVVNGSGTVATPFATS
jgi:hypothetical protein